ncbi:MAG: pyrroline-5-carboxylate reductase [Bacteroidetes bacterium]|nr:pyrroline-5-carboxylate reductase [Bacteroidota bacterium]
MNEIRNTRSPQSIAIIGCGNMGLTYARSFRQYGLCTAEQLLLVEKSAEQRAQPELHQLGQLTQGPGERLRHCQIVVLAVKPQDFAALAPELSPYLQPDQVLLSIMAGITMSRISDSLQQPLIVRAMPNLPARIGMGMTAFAALPEVDRGHLHMAETLLNTTGRAVFLEDESLLDAVTAVSGSGPAYFFYFVQEMVQAAVEMGLDEATARVLVKQTMLGSYHLLNQSEEGPAELIRSVSSRGGTTEAAFLAFSEGRLGEVLRNGLQRAESRARELSGAL